MLISLVGVSTSIGEREWRNWQTRTVQVRVPERAWGFKSPLAHHGISRCYRAIAWLALLFLLALESGESPGCSLEQPFALSESHARHVDEPEPLKAPDAYEFEGAATERPARWRAEPRAEKRL